MSHELRMYDSWICQLKCCQTDIVWCKAVEKNFGLDCILRLFSQFFEVHECLASSSSRHKRILRRSSGPIFNSSISPFSNVNLSFHPTSPLSGVRPLACGWSEVVKIIVV